MSGSNGTGGQSWGDKPFIPIDKYRPIQHPSSLTPTSPNVQIDPQHNANSSQHILRPAQNLNSPNQALGDSPALHLRGNAGPQTHRAPAPGWLGDREFKVLKMQLGGDPTLGAAAEESTGNAEHGKFDAVTAKTQPLKNTQKILPPKVVIEVQEERLDGVLVDNLNVSRGSGVISGTTSTTEVVPEESNILLIPTPPVTRKSTLDGQSQTLPTNFHVANTPETTNQAPATTTTNPTQQATEYIIPHVFDPYKYGHPSTNSPKHTHTKAHNPHPKPTTITHRPPSPKPRTITISNLPRHPTLSIISTILTNTGPLETITLFNTLRKSRITFINHTDATEFFKRTNGTITYRSPDGNTTHTSIVDMKPDMNFLSSATRYLVTHKGVTRTVLIVGWDRGVLEYLVDAEGEGMTFDALLMELARVYSYVSLDERIEGVKWRKNREGVLEGLLIYSRIKDAYCALEAMLLEKRLRSCKISYGKDPCAP